MRSAIKRVGQRYTLGVQVLSSTVPTRGSSFAFRAATDFALRLLYLESQYTMPAASDFDHDWYVYYWVYPSVITAPGSTSMTAITPQPMEPGGVAASFGAWYGTWDGSGNGTERTFEMALRDSSSGFIYDAASDGQIILRPGELLHLNFGDSDLAKKGLHAIVWDWVVEELR